MAARMISMKEVSEFLSAASPYPWFRVEGGVPELAVSEVKNRHRHSLVLAPASRSADCRQTHISI